METKQISDPTTAKFSFFRAPVTNKIPQAVMTIKDVYAYILGDIARERTEVLRKFTDSKEARAYKGKYFDYATFSGEFSYGSDDKLILHSNLICIDYDHVGDVRAVKEMLRQDPNFETQLLFTSPSGDGVKWVVSVELNRCDHRTWFKAIKNYVWATYHLEADASGVNVSRACFLPHDPEVYVNPNVCPF